MIYTIKAELLESALPVSRTFRVDAEDSLAMLSYYLQTMFNFDGGHLYAFQGTGNSSIRYGMPDDSGFGEDEMEDAEEYTVSDLLKQANSVAGYTYDFGDNWEFRLKVLKTEAGELEYPEVTAFEGPNLIDDVGGVPGFEALLASADNPEDPAYAEYRPFVEDYYAERGARSIMEALAFDREEVNLLLSSPVDVLEEGIQNLIDVSKLPADLLADGRLDVARLSLLLEMSTILLEEFNADEIETAINTLDDKGQPLLITMLRGAISNMNTGGYFSAEMAQA